LFAKRDLREKRSEAILLFCNSPTLGSRSNPFLSAIDKSTRRVFFLFKDLK